MTDEHASPGARAAGSSSSPATPHPPPVDPPAPRSTYDREIAEVKDNVLRMGAARRGQIRAAIDALVAHDAEAALTVIRDDGHINEVQRKATAMIAAIIATQNPVARDLRFLLTLDHVSYELERMGDHASSVAKQARKLAPVPAARATTSTCRCSASGSPSSCTGSSARSSTSTRSRPARSPARDDEVDDLYHAIFDEVLVLMREDAANVETGTRILFASHYLERIGDRVTNIAEDIVFLASGEVEDLNP